MRQMMIFAPPVVLITCVIGLSVFADEDPLREHIPARDPLVSSQDDPVAPPGMRTEVPAFQKGVSIYWKNNPKDGDEVVQAKARRLFEYVKSLGANAVSINFNYFMTGERASAVVADKNRTPSPERMELVLAEVVRSKLHATVRPVLEESSLRPTKSWRGSIRPASRAAWFASYRRFMTPYLQVAEKWKAGSFVIGVELSSLEGDRAWGPLYEYVSGKFSGEVSYHQNFDQFQKKRIRMEKLGIDLYPPIDASDAASVTTVTALLSRWLDKTARGPQPNLLISETGIPAQSGAYGLPYSWHSTKPENLRVQSTWYAAACNVAKQRQMAGLYWWGVDFDTDPEKAEQRPNSFDFAGRSGTEQAIADCFKGA